MLCPMLSEEWGTGKWGMAWFWLSCGVLEKCPWEEESSQVCKTAGNMESKAGRSIAILTAVLQPDILIFSCL